VERDAKYVAVGIFVLLVIAMGIAFVLWYGDARNGRRFDLYEIYFSGTVSGLDQGSVVRYLGVDVGRVRRLTISRKDSVRVKVTVGIDSNAPITGATRANLQLQGVATGILFIDLRDAKGADPAAPLAQGEKYPVIETVPSADIDTILSSIPALVSRATVLIDRVNELFSERNLAALSKTVENLRATTQNLPQTSAKVTALVDELSGAVRTIDGAANDVRAITGSARPQIQDVLQRFGAAADNLALTSQRLEQLVAGSEVQLNHFSEQGLLEIDRLIRDSRNAAREFRDLSRGLKQNPSQLLYEPPPSGVEVPP
jgi:phospholipid/cholesterol/gamma-HCH transport system substrate-binding protein